MKSAENGYYTRTRNRIFSIPAGVSSTLTEIPGQKPIFVTSKSAVSVVGRQTTIDRDNSFQAYQDIAHSDSAHANSKAAVRNLDIGGSFYTVDNKFTLSHPHWKTRLKDGATTRTYSGPLFPNGSGVINPQSNEWTVIPAPSDLTMINLGATAISLCEPTNPHADLVTGLAEIIREGAPRAPLEGWKEAVKERRIASEAGGEHLNWAFGITPIVNDVYKLCDAIIKSDKLMKQYARDSGRVVRRRYHFPTTVTNETLADNNGVTVYPGIDSRLFVGNVSTGRLIKTRETEVKTWFSGAFIYGLPAYAVVGGKHSVFARDVARARKLYGLRLDVEVLWNLAPWSWFIDWFTSAGSVMHNVAAQSNQNGLVMKYGYIMRETRVTTTYTHSGLVFKDGATGPITATFETVQKTRLKAHPFGFGVDVQNLSANQIAIMAALGLSWSGK